MSKILRPRQLPTFKKEQAYLVLINPDKIPHLVLVDQNKYFALTYKESIIGKDFEVYFESLKRAKKKVLFVELNLSLKVAREVFQKYDVAGENSCFVPIKEVLLPTSQASFIFQLIPELYEQNLISKAHHLNLQPDLDDLGDFKMTTYSKDDIYSYIQSLKERNAQRFKSIS